MSEHYSYRVFWSPEDGEFVGVCSEFPSLSHLAPTHEGALQGIRELVDATVADLRRTREPIPEALADKNYSGHLQVRIPSNLHRNLALEAAELSQSLNRTIINRLLASTGANVTAVAKKRPGRPMRTAAQVSKPKRSAKRRSPKVA